LRTSTLARAGAVATAAALAFTLGAGPASASDDISVERGFTTVPKTPALKKAPQSNLAAPAQRMKASLVTAVPNPAPNLTTFALARDQVLYAKGEKNLLQGTVVIANEPDGFFNLTTQFFNTHESLDYSPQLFTGTVSGPVYGGVAISPAKGPGLYKFGPPSGIFYGDNFETDFVNDLTASNTIRVRNATNGETHYFKSGKKHQVTVDIKVFKPAVGIFGSGITSARLQYKSGSTWKPYKTVKLNKYGKGAYSWSTSTKRTYRILVPTTLSIQGGDDRDSKGRGIYF
jgi:hypothetical protein